MDTDNILRTLTSIVEMLEQLNVPYHLLRLTLAYDRYCDTPVYYPDAAAE